MVSIIFDMKTFNQIISIIIRISLIFLLYFTWTRYYIKSLIWALILSSVLTLITDWLLTSFSKRKDLKKSLKKDELARAEGYCNNFIFNNKSEAVNFFYKLFNKFSPVKRADYIFFEKENQKIVLFPFYKFNKLIMEDLIFVYNKIKDVECDKMILCINDITEPIKKIAMKLPIKFVILDKYETYEQLMKKFNIYPDKSFNFDDQQKFTFKNILAISLNRNKARGYIFASIILFISSFFVRITIYYLIMSSILLLLSIFSYINPIYNKTNSDTIF